MRMLDNQTLSPPQSLQFYEYPIHEESLYTKINFPTVVILLSLQLIKLNTCSSRREMKYQAFKEIKILNRMFLDLNTSILYVFINVRSILDI